MGGGTDGGSKYATHDTVGKSIVPGERSRGWFPRGGGRGAGSTGAAKVVKVKGGGGGDAVGDLAALDRKKGIQEATVGCVELRIDKELEAVDGGEAEDGVV
jgi:hypothetical protein